MFNAKLVFFYFSLISRCRDFEKLIAPMLMKRQKRQKIETLQNIYSDFIVNITITNTIA